MKKRKLFFSLLFFFFQLPLFFPFSERIKIEIENKEILTRTTAIARAVNLETGKELFLKNCAVCHIQGNNVIIPEKNLKKEALEENGMNNINAISYQILNGKNGMPAFGERLKESEIEIIAKYVLEQSELNFQN